MSLERRCKTPRPSQACCSPPKHWSRRFLKRKKLLQCHRAAWAAWITKPNANLNSNSRTLKGPAVLLEEVGGKESDGKIGFVSLAEIKSAIKHLSFEQRAEL